MKVFWPSLPFDMLCRDSYHNQKYLSHHPSSILLAWPPVFRFRLFYLLKSGSKSEKLDFLRKYAQNSDQNGQVDYDRTCGWYLRVLGGFMFSSPPTMPHQNTPNRPKFKVLGVCWRSIGGGQNYKNHPLYRYWCDLVSHAWLGWFIISHTTPGHHRLPWDHQIQQNHRVLVKFSS